MSDTYRTLGGTGEALLREKASKFIGRAFPIASAADFKAQCEAIAREHHTARHVCYGWVLGDAGEQHRANDAGEPAGTAGRPILRPLQAAQLTYAAIVVVRYFGGTLLGKAGLVHAYGAAAQLALDQAPIITRVLMDEVYVECTYALMGVIKRDTIALGGEVRAADMAEQCTLRIALPRSGVDAALHKWALAGAGVRRDQP